MPGCLRFSTACAVIRFRSTSYACFSNARCGRGGGDKFPTSIEFLHASMMFRYDLVPIILPDGVSSPVSKAHSPMSNLTKAEEVRIVTLWAERRRGLFVAEMTELCELVKRLLMRSRLPPKRTSTSATSTPSRKPAWPGASSR
jgi:hypothetical protein